MIVALFDSDGTLYSNQMGRGMMKYEELNGRKAAAQMYFASLLPGFVLNKLGLMKTEAFQQALLNGLTKFIKELKVKEAESHFEWLVQEFLLLSERADVVARLKDHQSRGHLVVIASGSFTPALDLIGQHFGVADLIGTQLEVSNDKYTGRMTLPVITGKAKAEKIRGLLSARNVDVDWPSSYAYGDSFTDREMLNLVGHPVAVYPDKKLFTLATQQNWEIIGTPK
jgi:HAD superfamily hydrolase (TIGR01490 family)